VSAGMGEPRVLPAGDRALLLAPGEQDDLDGWVDLLRGAEVPGMQDFLPAAETLLVTLEAGAETGAVERALRELLATSSATRASTDAAAEEVVIPVRYNGEDLADVADLLGVGVDEVIARHTGQVWRCRFIGFTAGFGYLTAPDAQLTVPRRAQSRTAVPPGAVGLADAYSAVYPRRAPGGWQLIGSTDEAMWDLSRSRPALLAAGTRVRFVAVSGCCR
jgi:KipI family sensor histidine kinase inhibitor